MRLIIFGPPGSGKGTLSSRLASKLRIDQIATGDMIREEMKQNTELGKTIASYANKGELVPDEIVVKALSKRLNQPNDHKGFILDGYPRTLEQAKALEGITRIDAIIRINIPESMLIERLSNRIICRKCGTIYNLKYLKPKKVGECDICGEELYTREDDKPTVIKERLKIYEMDTQPIIEYYEGKMPFVDVRYTSIKTPPEVMIKEILDGLQKSGLSANS
jgi:adenylate kinase